MAGPAGASRFSGRHGLPGRPTARRLRRAARVLTGAGGPSGQRQGRSPWRSKAAAGRRCAPSRRLTAGPRAGPPWAQRGLPVRGPWGGAQDAVPPRRAPGKACTWPRGRDRGVRLGPLQAPARPDASASQDPLGSIPTAPPPPGAAASWGHLAGRTSNPSPGAEAWERLAAQHQLGAASRGTSR